MDVLIIFYWSFWISTQHLSFISPLCLWSSLHPFSKREITETKERRRCPTHCWDSLCFGPEPSTFQMFPVMKNGLNTGHISTQNQCMWNQASVPFCNFECRKCNATPKVAVSRVNEWPYCLKQILLQPQNQILPFSVIKALWLHGVLTPVEHFSPERHMRMFDWPCF